MIHKVIMPKLGESVTEGTIVKWLVKPGDTIKQYDNILEVETDKVVAEVPATEGGVIKELLFKEGETVKVGTVICTMELDSQNSSLKQTEVLKNYDVDSNMSTNKNIDKNINNKAQLVKNNSTINKSSGRYSPSVISLAQEHGIDLANIQGTGFEGRITRKDILNYISTSKSEQSEYVSVSDVSNRSDNNTTTNTNNYTSKEDSYISSLPNDTKLSNNDILIPVSAVRRTIAKKMVESVSSIPHAWLTIEVDATDLVALRNKIKSEFLAKEGYNITYFAFFVVEIVKALRKLLI